MSRLHLLLKRFAVAMVVALIVSYSPTPAGACPPFDRYEAIYDYCLSTNQIGYIYRGCSCGTETGGLTNGLYRIDTLSYCDSGEEFSTEYYGRCNPGDAWTKLADGTSCPNWC
jgi:hypothetical protein